MCLTKLLWSHGFLNHTLICPASKRKGGQNLEVCSIWSGLWDWDRIGTGASLKMSVSICDLLLLQKYKYVFHFHHFVCPENMLSAGEENRFLEKAKRKIPKLLSKYATNIFSFGLACLGFNIVKFKFWYKLIYSLESLFTV